jgi:hypothetical protein
MSDTSDYINPSYDFDGFQVMAASLVAKIPEYELYVQPKGMTALGRQNLKRGLGDILVTVAHAADVLGFDLHSIAVTALEDLEQRTKDAQ